MKLRTICITLTFVFSGLFASDNASPNRSIAITANSGTYQVSFPMLAEASDTPTASTLHLYLHTGTAFTAASPTLLEALSALPSELRPTLAILDFADPDRGAQLISDLTIDEILTQPGTGGGERFIAAIRDEILPQILAVLDDAPQRIVFHTSDIGSAIAFQILFHHHDLFDHIWIESPSMTFHRTFAMRAEYEFYKAMHTSLPRNVLLTSLSSESDEDSFFPLTILQRLLATRNYSDLEFTWINGRELGIDDRATMTELALEQIYGK